MPTKTEQSNLDHLVFSGHGEIPRFVIAPGTVEDAFYLGAQAFNLAEQYQVPVFILTEQALCQSKATLPLLDVERVRVDRGKLQTDPVVFGEYKRFAFTEDGVSPRVIPGVEGGMHLAPGSEHNDAGVITENARNRERMMEKRMRKMVSARKDLPAPLLHGDPKADIAFLGYGSSRGPICEAQERLAGSGVATKFLELRTLWPFPEEEVKAFADGVSALFVVEGNFTGQLLRHVRSLIGPIDALQSIRKYNGKPFRPIEIIEPAEAAAKKLELVEVRR